MCSSINLLYIKIIVKPSAFICQSTWTFMFIIHTFPYTLKYSITKRKKSTSMRDGLFVPFGDKIYRKELHFCWRLLYYGVAIVLIHKIHNLFISSSFHGIGILPIFLMKKVLRFREINSIGILTYHLGWLDSLGFFSCYMCWK